MVNCEICEKELVSLKALSQPEQSLKCFKEKEILVHKGVPTIKYKDINGQIRDHFPDIYVPRYNWIFECKCNYTWNPDEKTKRNNILKIKSAKKQGFSYNLIMTK